MADPSFLTPAGREALKQLSEAATKGPVYADPGTGVRVKDGATILALISSRDLMDRNPVKIGLLAAARNAIPAGLEYVEALEACADFCEKVLAVECGDIYEMMATVEPILARVAAARKAGE